MKYLLIILFFPFTLLSQNIDGNVKIQYEEGIDSLIQKNQDIINKKDGVLGWRVQLTFKSTKEEIKKLE